MSRRPAGGGGRHATPTSAARRLGGRNVSTPSVQKAAVSTPSVSNVSVNTNNINTNNDIDNSMNQLARRGSHSQSQADGEEEERGRQEAERSKIATAFGARFQSIGEIRRQIDSLQNKHKAEELALIDTMQSLLQQNRTESESSLKKLRREMEEKQQAVDLYNQFKDQGGDIIQRLSTTLTDLQHKYAEDGKRCVDLQKEVIELEQRLREERTHRFGLEHQLAQLRHSEVAQPPLSQSISNTTIPDLNSVETERERRITAEKLVDALSQKNQNQQIAKLHQLIREKDAKLVVLTETSKSIPTTPRQESDLEWEGKYKVLEAKYSKQLGEYQSILLQQEKLTSQTEEHNKVLRGQVKELEAKLCYVTSEGAFDQFDETSATVDNVLSGSPDEESMSMLENKVVHMLVQQLKSEKRQRLETEEQSSRMLQEASKTVTTLEQRVKQAETPRVRRKSTPTIPQSFPIQPSSSSPVDYPVKEIVDLSVEQTLEKWARLRPNSDYGSYSDVLDPLAAETLRPTAAQKPNVNSFHSSLIEISPPRSTDFVTPVTTTAAPNFDFENINERSNSIGSNNIITNSNNNTAISNNSTANRPSVPAAVKDISTTQAVETRELFVCIFLSFYFDSC